MPEEKDYIPTDDDLKKAFGTEAPPPVEEAPPETPPVKDEEEEDRSMLGRKVKELRDQMDNVVTKAELKEMQTMLNKLLEQRNVQPDRQEPQADADDDEIITTKKEARDLAREVARREFQDLQKQEKQIAAQKLAKYTETVIDLGKDLEDDLKKEVEQELIAHHNDWITGDPERDAQTNFMAAMKAVIKQKGSARSAAPPLPQNPLKEKTGADSTAPGGKPPSERPSNVRQIGNFDSDAAKRLAAQMSDEDIQAAAASKKAAKK